MLMSVWVLRLGHRIRRDKRISTHCCLVARALGADGLIYTGEKDGAMEDSVRKVVQNWGGKFRVKHEKRWQSALKKWKGRTCHLTVYGMPFEKEMAKVRKAKDLLLVVGGEKVPIDVYRQMDWNISITSQPHSEVAGLALVMDRYFRGKFPKFSGKLSVVPQKAGKKVIKA
jgi:tRNA (cytidine56-2'-O)-methyltransferase